MPPLFPMWMILNLFSSVAGIILAILLLWTLWIPLALLIAKRKTDAILLGLPASILLVAIIIAAYWFHSTRPTTIFANAFGFPLPADTTLLNSSSSNFGDSGSTHIHLRTSPTTLARITASYAASGAYNGSNPPPWFKPPPDSPTLLHFFRQGAVTSPGSFSSELRYITYDPTTGEAWYVFRGVD